MIEPPSHIVEMFWKFSTGPCSRAKTVLKPHHHDSVAISNLIMVPGTEIKFRHIQRPFTGKDVDNFLG